MTARGNRKLVNIYIDEKLWKAAKIDAALRGMTLQRWMEWAIRNRLHGNTYSEENKP